MPPACPYFLRCLPCGPVAPPPIPGQAGRGSRLPSTRRSPACSTASPRDTSTSGNDAVTVTGGPGKGARNVTTDAVQVATPGYGWGYNNAGGLGIGSVARALDPVPVQLPAGTTDMRGGTDFTVALTSSGQVWAWGGNRYGQLGDGSTKVRLAPERVRLGQRRRQPYRRADEHRSRPDVGGQSARPARYRRHRPPPRPGRGPDPEAAWPCRGDQCGR